MPTYALILIWVVVIVLALARDAALILFVRWRRQGQAAGARPAEVTRAAVFTTAYATQAVSRRVWPHLRPAVPVLNLLALGALAVWPVVQARWLGDADLRFWGNWLWCLAPGRRWLWHARAALGLARLSAPPLAVPLLAALVGLNLHQGYPLSRARSLLVQSLEAEIVRPAQIAQRSAAAPPPTVTSITDPAWGIDGLRLLSQVYPIDAHTASRSNRYAGRRKCCYHHQTVVGIGLANRPHAADRGAGQDHV